MIRDGLFRKASGSDTGGCVEIAASAPGGVSMRDSKDRRGPVLSYSDTDWAAFIAAVKAGEFNLPR